MNSERLEQESYASAALLAEAIENKRRKATFKQGDKMPEFLANYSVKILTRATSHPPPDSLAECLTPYLYHSDGVYYLSQKDIDHGILNILNTLYEFEKDSGSAPSKLSHWLNQTFKGKNKSSVE